MWWFINSLVHKAWQQWPARPVCVCVCLFGPFSLFHFVGMSRLAVSKLAAPLNVTHTCARSAAYLPAPLLLSPPPSVATWCQRIAYILFLPVLAFIEETLQKDSLPLHCCQNQLAHCCSTDEKRHSQPALHWSHSHRANAKIKSNVTADVYRLQPVAWAFCVSRSFCRHADKEREEQWLCVCARFTHSH